MGGSRRLRGAICPFFPSFPVESDKSQLCRTYYYTAREGRILASLRLQIVNCACPKIWEKLSHKNGIAANLDPISPRDIVRKSRETNALYELQQQRQKL